MAKRSQQKTSHEKESRSGPGQKIIHLNAEDIEDAEVAVLRYVQERHFPKERKVLQRQGDSCDRTGVLKKSSSLHRLDPVILEGLNRL